MQTGNAAASWTKPLTFAWATGTTLQAAITAALAGITPSAITWTTYFSAASGSLSAPMLKQPRITVRTAAADGVLISTGALAGFSLLQNVPFSFSIEDTSSVTYTGGSSASVFLEA